MISGEWIFAIFFFLILYYYYIVNRYYPIQMLVVSLTILPLTEICGVASAKPNEQK